MPDKTKVSPQKTPTFTFSIEPTGPENTPEQQHLRVCINRVYDAIEKKLDRAELDRRVADLKAALDDFEGSDHSSPGWARENAWGNATYAMFVANGSADQRLFKNSIAHQETSLDFAINDGQRAKSLNNLCDLYRRDGRFEEAVQAGMKACALWPTHEGVIVNFALALYDSGRKSEANEALQRLLEIAGTQQSVLAAHARFEPDFQRMNDLPVVQAITGKGRS